MDSILCGVNKESKDGEELDAAYFTSNTYMHRLEPSKLVKPQGPIVPRGQPMKGLPLGTSTPRTMGGGDAANIANFTGDTTKVKLDLESLDVSGK